MMAFNSTCASDTQTARGPGRVGRIEPKRSRIRHALSRRSRTFTEAFKVGFGVSCQWAGGPVAVARPLLSDSVLPVT
jgi:hypothetical protein